MDEISSREGTLELLNSEVSERLARQATAGASIDTKAIFLAGAAATATQFLASRHGVDPLLSTVAFASYLTSLLAAISTHAISRYMDVPNPRALLVLSNEDKSVVLKHLLAARTHAYEVNKRIMSRKAVTWWLSVATLGVGLALSTAAMV